MMSEFKLSVDPQGVLVLSDASDEQLNEFLLFAVVVAGKSAATQKKKLEALLARIWRDNTGARSIMHALCSVSLAQLRHHLEAVGMGQYNRLAPLIAALAYAIVFQGLDLRTCTAEQLETFKGIGPKTARFFLLFTRKGYRCAVLDTHILQWMHEHCTELGLQTSDIPRSTPSGARYLKLEAAFILYCDNHGLSIAEHDFAIWKAGSEK